MLAEDPNLRKCLAYAISHLTRNSTLAEDLLQEALAHLAQIEHSFPDRVRNWYLKNCEFFVQNLLRHGRSVDSEKHRFQRIRFNDESNPADLGGFHLDPDDSLAERLSADDFLAVLLQLLPPLDREILIALHDGRSTGQIARELHLSRETVRTHRLAIAAAAKRLGLAPKRRKSRSRK